MNKLKQNYAKLILTRGVNLQKGQILVIDTPLWTADFTHIVAEEAYKLGAKDVVIHYADVKTDRLRLLYADDETLTEIPNWLTESQTHYADKNAAFLRLNSGDPSSMDGVDAARAARRQKALNAPLEEMKLARMSNLVTWSAAPVPNAGWAKRVFPHLAEPQAVEALWSAVFSCCYVSEQSATDGWDSHIASMLEQVKAMNDLKLRQLHFQNILGTDLTLNVSEGGVFAGGICHCPEPDGILFAPNIPTEEILTTPHRFSANGAVYNTKPLVYGGSVVDQFHLTFTDGIVTEWDCKIGKEILAGILSTDEGSRRLGEVALVPYNSPINQTGVLFYDTLFDENASCHLALGMGYTDVMPGADRSRAALVARGLNTSMLHVDFMFGSKDMRCEGVCENGDRVMIFENGVFAL